MPLREPRKLQASYWRKPWKQARNNADANGAWNGPKDDRSADAFDNYALTKDHTGTYYGVFLSQPLGQTYIDPELFLHHQEAVEAAGEGFHWLSSMIRNACGNSVYKFLNHFKTAEGRYWLVSKGLRLLDDDGQVVNVYGERASEAVAPQLQDKAYWLPKGGSVRPPNLDLEDCPYCGQSKNA